MSRLALVDWVPANGAIAPRTKLNKNRQAFMRKAKIVDTIGPSTEDYDNLLKLVEAGMDVARLNRSHGTPEDHLKVYNNVRKASEATGRNVAALVDLQGPKTVSYTHLGAVGADDGRDRTGGNGEGAMLPDDMVATLDGGIAEHDAIGSFTHNARLWQTMLTIVLNIVYGW